MPRLLRTLIVDDEALARDRLKRMLAEFEQVEIVGDAANGREAVERIRSLRPDLVFLDVQMPGWDGFRVLTELETPPLIVFATAYDEFALRAFEVSAVDYLLKPIERKRLAQAIRKVEQVSDLRIFRERLDALVQAVGAGRRPLRHLGVRKGDRILVVPVSDVLYFQADAKETSLVTRDGEFFVDRSLGELEAQLDPDRFFRTHRSYLVNLEHVQELLTWFAGTCRARLEDGREIPVSRRRARELRARLSVSS